MSSTVAAAAESSKDKEKPKKNKHKIVLRRLPPHLTWDELKEQLDPLPPTDYVSFCPADFSFVPHAFSRCYFVFTNDEDVIPFSEKWNRYVFVDSKGYESAAMVELAMHQKIPRKRKEDMAKDSRCGIIEQEPEYLRFVDELEAARNMAVLTIEEQLRNVHLRETSNKAGSVQSTPLTEFVIKLFAEKSMKKEEKRRAMDKMRKARVEKEKEERHGKERGFRDDHEADRILKKLGVGKGKEERKSSPPAGGFGSSGFGASREGRTKDEKARKTPISGFGAGGFGTSRNDPSEEIGIDKRDRDTKVRAKKERPPKVDRPKKDRPERELYRPGQRNRQNRGEAPDDRQQ